jgi:pimeloyl-ACP methyl ester carboxylesterase
MPILSGALTRTRSWFIGAVILGVALLGLAFQARPAPATSIAKPTVVLVHGAFADASGWNGVTNRLQRLGYPVLAPANPLRGLATDSDYLRSVLATVDGPVVLVGHSYGGMVISNAATGNPNVKALVYVAAYAPHEGDTVGGLSALAPGSMLGPDAITVRTFPGPDGTPIPEGYIKLDLFGKIFANDLPTATADAMAVAQRPAALSSLTDLSGPPAWKTIPSWYMVARQDHTIGTANERIMASRIGAHTVEVNASHVAMISRPGATTRLIVTSAEATR